MMDEQTRAQVAARLNRAAGQVGGIQRMIDEDRYCVDVLLQIAAARAALAKAGKLLLESHIRTCVAQAFESTDPDDQAEKIAELIRVFDKTAGA
ncbi:MAG: metal-sensitive transcriptional regulator [Gammaproteobacteria bacterium]